MSEPTQQSTSPLSPLAVRVQTVARALGLPELQIQWLVAALDEPDGEFQTFSALEEHDTWQPDGQTLVADDSFSADDPTVELSRESRHKLGLGDGDGERYRDDRMIGAGGMGEVRRVHDRQLQRNVAMKIMLARDAQKSRAVERFISEAQTTAQLEHPGIVPVYELGCREDGRHFFTMKEVRGRTLAEVIEEVHANVRDGRFVTGPSGWSFQRLIAAVHRVCEAVAYAHDRNVLHRDLKPSNVMVGAFGEVVVMDWGLAKVVGSAEPLPEHTDPVITDRELSEWSTRHGTVSGTPAYMSPEQARGEVETLTLACDVYSLGAVLFKALTGKTALHGLRGLTLLTRVAHGPEVDAPGPTDEDARQGADLQGRPPVPVELSQICRRAMSHAETERYGNALELARELAGWLDGAKRRQQALAAIAKADEMLPRARALESQAAESLRDALARLALAKHQDVTAKREGWRIEELAESQSRQAKLLHAEAIQVLQMALTMYPDLPEAHDRLALHWLARHRSAERRRDAMGTAEAEVQLRAHGARRHRAYLDARAQLSLNTDPSGASVRAFRFVERDRRLQLELVGELGHTPLESVPIQAGSYVLEIRAHGRQTVRYPIFLERLGDWTASQPVVLPVHGAVPPEAVYVPAGPVRLGGDPQQPDSLDEATQPVDGFVIAKEPVTFAEFLRFLDALVADGRGAEAHRHAPRERGGYPLARLGDDGRYQMVPDDEGVLYDAEWPVMLIDFDGALSYAGWLAQCTGLPWRLPTELEWVKAARGVDGRYHPWGDRFDLSFCRSHESRLGRSMPGRTDEEPLDCSPYGVLGMAGGMRDFVGTGYVPEGGSSVAQTDPEFHPVVRGGAWNYGASRVRLAYRNHHARTARFNNLSFRLARSFPEEDS